MKVKSEGRREGEREKGRENGKENNRKGERNKGGKEESVSIESSSIPAKVETIRRC